MVLATKKNCQRVLAASLRVVSAMTGNPPLSGDPDHQRQTQNFSKEETKNPSRNEECEKVGFEPGTP